MKEIKVVKVPKYVIPEIEIESPHLGKVITLDTSKLPELTISDFIKDYSDVEYKKLLLEIIIRFNTEPKKYEKQDFKKLIEAIIEGDKINDEFIKQVKEDLLQLISDNKDYTDADIEALRQYLLNQISITDNRLNSKIDLTKIELKSKIKYVETNLTNSLNLTKIELDSKINTKVDKESGKSLMSDEEHLKLAGIESGAEVNVQSDWDETDISRDSFVKNKPTKLSQFKDDLGFNPKHTHELYATLQQLETKQDLLIPGGNIKTINGESLIGSGNITTNPYQFSFLTEEQWEGLSDKLENVVYFIYEDEVSVETEWKFGNKFPIVFGSTLIWKFGSKFPISFGSANKIISL